MKARHMLRQQPALALLHSKRTDFEYSERLTIISNTCNIQPLSVH